MSLLNFLFPQGTHAIVQFGPRVILTCFFVLARPILVRVGVELLERARAFTVRRAVRYVSVSSILILLMFSSARANFLRCIDDALEAMIHADTTGLRHAAGRAAVLVGEIILLHFAACLLQIAVHFFSAWIWSVG
jgi:hypothetical protein